MHNLQLKARELSKTYTTAQVAKISKNIKQQPPTIIGQKRAIRALEFGLGNKAFGFNIYVSGYPGLGKHTAIQHFLKTIASKENPPKDWCYVNNFKNPYSPKCLSLPQGYGYVFKKEVKKFLLEARAALNRGMSSKEYLAERDAIKQEWYAKEMELMTPFQRKAEAANFIIQRTPTEVNAYPNVNGEPMTDKEFSALDDAKKAKILKKRDAFKEELIAIAHKVEKIGGIYREKQMQLEQSVAIQCLESALNKLKEKYSTETDVVAYLEDLKADLLENLTEFLKFSPNLSPLEQTMMLEKDGMMPPRYEVNVLIDNTLVKGAPIIIEQNPTYNNLFGKIEKESLNGTLITNLSLIRGGALHRANGGYLILPIEEVLKNYFSWDSLKRALINQEIDIEEPGDRLGFLTTKSLKPKAIPLEVQIILIGKPIYYQQLYYYDSDFKKLFKVKADFDASMDTNQENIADFIGLLNQIEKKEKLLPISLDGKARLLELSHRLSQDQQKLSTRFGEILDSLREAHHYAKQNQASQIDATSVEKAIEEKKFRSSLWQEKMQEMVQQEELFIDLEGSEIGQVNGLSVVSAGDTVFGRPNRITASVSLGQAGIIDIEREVKLGGPIHSKGVMILKGYLAEKFGQDKLLNLSAQLVFEQSYGEIEGDSASSTELYALLSNLSQLPVNQGIAITGSVNQKGKVQPVGGINEKIEGFFEACQLKGLTGGQGVMIPFANKAHLMLRKEVVDAVKNGQFHIWAIQNIAEGIEILTGVTAGKKLEKTYGYKTEFEKDTVFDKINQRLKKYSKNIYFPFGKNGIGRKKNPRRQIEY